MKVRLIERGRSPDQTRDIPVTQSEFLIGRGADCNLRLRIPAISRHHCIIRLGTDEATLVDLGSSNGTYLNDQRVRSQAPLHSGDELRIGTCCFVVDLGDRASLIHSQTVEVDTSATTIKLREQAAEKEGPGQVLENG